MERIPRSPLDAAMLEDGRRNDWLADKVDAYPEQVSRWRSGAHEPIKRTQREIARALGRTVDELWPNTDQADDEQVAA